MGSIDGTRMDIFFAPIVGSPQAAQQFEASLANTIRSASPNIDAFDALERGLSNRTRDLAGADTYPDPEDFDPWQAERIIKNGALAGRLVVGGLQTVGEIYADHVAKTGTSQRLEVVQRNVGRVLEHLRFATNAGRGIAIRNTFGLMHAVEPGGTEVELLIQQAVSEIMPDYMPAEFTWPTVSRDSFTAQSDGAHQLHIEPKLTLVQGGGRCPAVFARVEGLRPGHRRSALKTYMNVISGVVISEIYAQRFPIQGLRTLAA